MTVIAWIGPLPPPVHGASIVTARLLELVRARDADVRVVSTIGDGLGLRHHVSRISAHLEAARVIARLPREGVLYLSLSGGLGLWYQVPLVALARLRALRVVVHHHSYAYLTTWQTPMALIAHLLRSRDRHLLLSASMERSFLARYPTAAPSSVVSNAWFVEPDDGRVGRDDRADLRLVHVSNLTRAKGSDVAVRTAVRLGAPLTLVGPCTDPAVESVLDAPGVRWLGAQPTGTVYAELADADLFLFPSSYVNEAEPMVVLEALSRGVPVIATRRGALAEMLPTAWLVDHADADALAERVLSVTAQPGWRSAGAAQARAVFDALRAGADPVDVVLDR